MVVIKKHLFTIAFISWLVFITFSSLYSFSDIDVKSYMTIPHLDKVVHFVFYFVACILGVLAVREKAKGGITSIKAILISSTATIIFGIIIEILQCTITIHRMGDFFDGLSNSIGSICGALLMFFCFQLKQN